jgi:hypothetical protein
LNVSYLHEPPLQGGEATLDAERLAALPRALRARMREALQRLDVLAIENALAELRVLDPQAAAVLSPLVERFSFERMAAPLDDLA